MGEVNLPTVSFIIPTLNAERQLKHCLRSIDKQIYPKNIIEILVIDGGSTDKTLAIAKKHKAQIINNPKKDPESAKYIGIKRSHGELIALLDADNYIKGNQWLKHMVRPFLLDEEIFGIESFYFSRREWGSVNEYLMLMHIADPVARVLASKLEKIEHKNYIEYRVPPHGMYPVGADGFIWKRKVIEAVGFNKKMFEEANFSFRTYEKGFRKFARVKNTGIYHDYARSLKEYIKKRSKIANKNMKRVVNDEDIWILSRGQLRMILSFAYCASFIGPLIEAIVNLYRSKRLVWLWHPIFCLATVVVYSYNYLRFKVYEAFS